MYISEIFYSLQGEGSLTGIPSVFIRTSGCNLRCIWCDTKYASWEPEGTELTVDAIISRVSAYPADNVVITGGEPLIAGGIHELTGKLQNLQKHITIETAGTVAPEGIVCDLASISPKLSNSNPGKKLSREWSERHENRRIQPEILDEWISNYEYQLKFVITSEADIGEINDVINRLKSKIPPSNVYLMPEGISAEELKKHENFVIELCQKHGYRYCDRLHIRLFGNTRGK